MTRMLRLGLLWSLAAWLPAHAAGRLADVTIVDRDTGATLTPYYYRGEYWVAGTPGARYAIRVHNRRGERLLAIASVDGLNVLTGAVASWDQAGYVFDPDQDYEISGWRKSDDEVAAFTFTDPSSSYAGRTGRPANIGIIGVALYRERPRIPPQIGELAPPGPPPPVHGPVPRLGAEPAAPSAGMQAQRAAPADSLDMRERQAVPFLPAPTLGTGHGEREYSHVDHTTFDRLQEEPNEIIHIRYDRLERLIAMGIVRRPHPVWPNLNAFPGSPGISYVPDPPG